MSSSAKRESLLLQRGSSRTLVCSSIGRWKTNNGYSLSALCVCVCTVYDSSPHSLVFFVSRQSHTTTQEEEFIKSFFFFKKDFSSFFPFFPNTKEKRNLVSSLGS